jgi:hypothetical protein
MTLPPSPTGFYWSVRGHVACLEHVARLTEAQWIAERWEPLPASSQGHGGNRYQCQYCSPERTAVVHSTRAS